MLGLGKLLQVQGDQQGGDEEVENKVEGLLQRVSESSLLQDRRQALFDLRDLLQSGSPQAAVAFGSMGFPIALAVLREDREEVEMIRAVLECVSCAVSQDAVQGGNQVRRTCCRSLRT